MRMVHVNALSFMKNCLIGLLMKLVLCFECLSLRGHVCYAVLCCATLWMEVLIKLNFLAERTALWTS